ncbi:50S ribosomal protein L32 [Anaerotalea alkaliphila]|uniref:Large ribosomal subunit protein bL32 n=1 Tax=Anaerotalea alkaliphila TaxID=2662126 RepID=A0A7X5KLI4_9FIRM|nr:50S ribosomal protein L32 [Anaerotalea alkaliphila]NDL66871.1 50S ribosomal protein L32 [Anaerotalea alkaliphila]
MAVPKRKHSAARRDKRKANYKLTAPNLTVCSKCGEPAMPHRACRACGTYKNKAVVEVK